MKNLLTQFLILVVASHFGITSVFAQKKVKRKEVVVIELLIPGREEITKAEVLINQTPKLKNSVRGGGGCGNCDESQTPPYEFKAEVFKIDKNKTKVSFKIEVGDECRTGWVFTVSRNRKTKLQLNCGISLTAYYGFESEETN